MERAYGMAPFRSISLLDETFMAPRGSAIRSSRLSLARQRARKSREYAPGIFAVTLVDATFSAVNCPRGCDATDAARDREAHRHAFSAFVQFGDDRSRSIARLRGDIERENPRCFTRNDKILLIRQQVR